MKIKDTITGATKTAAKARGGQIASSLSSEAVQRAQKVACLRMAVLSGDYDPDSQKIANKILQSLTEYSLG